VTLEIRPIEDRDVDAVVDFSLCAWAPVFDSLRGVLGSPVFERLHPDWAAGQADAVRSTCTSGDLDVFVGLLDDAPVGFVAVALNAYHERMGAIEMIAVDPDHQRRGVAGALTAFAIDHMRAAGMDIAVVETGGDPGHEPARRSYEASGFIALPIARYFQLLSGS
jgi:GNAT superfamily N-acetyltransferase